MVDEYADILGADSLPVRRTAEPGFWSSLSFSTKVIFILVVLLAAYLAINIAWAQYLKWRERNYKLSLRRKHGIPDNDHRPFNVAWAAARTAREDQEKDGARRGRAPQVSVSAHEPRASQPEHLRLRPGSQRNSSYSTPTPGPPGRFDPTSESYVTIPSGSMSSNQPNPPVSLVHSNHNRVTFADGYNTSASPLDIHAELSPGPSRRSNRKNIGGILRHNAVSDINFARRAKRSHDGYDEEEDGGDNAKKTRLEGGEFIDGDEEAGWQYDSQPSYGHKRGLADDYDDDSDDNMGKRQREKRARKVSAEKEDVDDNMVVDEYDYEEPNKTSRGRKRDRTEARASIGGEEYPEDVEESKSRRKRRNQRKSDAGLSNSRGSKRHRDMEDEAEEEDSDDVRVNVASAKSSKKKRANRRREEEERNSDISMDDSVNGASSGKGRRIGEEWESNGQRFKIGPNGQRLRMALVKKARQKFVMPVDSVHPDRKANVEVYIEMWLTEEEYKEAKEQRLLSWQESPPETERSTPVSAIHTPKGSPPRQGKHLLWESTATPPPQVVQDNNPFKAPVNGASGASSSHRHSIASSVGLNINPFPPRRIASAFRGPANADLGGVPPSPGLSDSLSSPRTYRQLSKWEKQELEAKAMMKMREAMKKEEEKKEAAKPVMPTITLTRPPEDQGKTSTPPSFSLPGSGNTASNVSTAPKLSFGVPPASSNTAEQSKPAASPMPSFFANPSTPASTTAARPPVPTAPSTSGAPPSFSFAPAAGTKPQEKPAGIGLGFPSTTPTPTPAPAASTPSGSTPTPSQASTAGASKFNFGISSKPAEQSKDTTPGNPSNAGSGPSLFARMDPAPSSTSAPTPAAPDPSTTSSAPAQSPFSFAKPSSSSAPSVFGAPSNSQTQNPSQGQNQQGQTNSSTSAPSGGLKFSFGVNNANKNTTAVPTSSTLSGALGAPNASSTPSTPKPAGAENSSANGGNASGNTGSTTPAPLFSFATPKKATPSATPAPGAPDAPKPPTFSFPGAPASSPAPTGSSSSPFGGDSAKPGNIFGAPSGTSTAASGVNSAFGRPSAFGSPSTSNPFGSGGAFGAKAPGSDAGTEGGTKSAFGSSPNTFGSKATEASSNKDGDGSGSVPASGTTMSGNAFGFGVKPQEAGKSAFGFGASSAPTNTSATGSTTPASSSFGFGKQSTPASSSTEAPKSVFGTPNAFGGSSTPSSNNAAPSTSAAPSAFAFGGASNNGTASPFGAASNTSSPFGAAAKPDETKSPFSFGPPAPDALKAAALEGDKKPGFSFGASSTTPSATSTNGASGGSFSFKPSNTFGVAAGSSTTPASPFGAPASSGQSAFGGFGSNTNTGSSTSSTPVNPFSAFGSSGQQSK